jgi:broad specificity phosphatase PhoE
VKVYLIRHAQSEENILDLKQQVRVADFNEMLCDSHSTPLTKWGRFQAQLTVGRLDGSNIERLYTSPFDRAIQTASIIGRELGIKPLVLDDLREVIPQQLSERKSNESLRKLFVRSCIGMVLPGGGGEKLGSSYQRAQAVWARITSDQSREIAVVSHYGLISLILVSLRRDRNWRIISRDISNGGISLVERKI